MFEKGHSKIGGRKKGTPNKVTLIRADDLLLKKNFILKKMVHNEINFNII